MSRYLLHANGVSETIRGAPHPGVVTFLAEHEDLWLSSIVIDELEYGVRLYRGLGVFMLPALESRAAGIQLVRSRSCSG